MFRKAALVLGLLTQASLAHAGSGDAVAGAAFFKNNCMMCHVVKPGAKGIAAPNLFGIGGTVSGVGDFQFSAALKQARIKWSAETLDKFLSAPNKMVPGTRMITTVKDDATRANVVAYLLSLKK